MTPRLLVMPAAALAAFSLATPVRAQAYLPEDNLAYPVLVLVQGGGGTGFFVRRDRDLFLVTARHVLVNPQRGQLWSRKATLRALSKDVKETAVTVVPVPEDVLPVSPGSASDSPPSSPRTLLALGNSGYGVVASADAIIDLIAGF